MATVRKKFLEYLAPCYDCSAKAGLKYYCRALIENNIINDDTTMGKQQILVLLL